MIKNKNILIAYKLAFSFLGFSAVVTEIATLAERGVFNPANFFSFFTIESNILVAITFLLSALAIAAGKKTRALDALRGLSTMAALIVGIGFAVLLSGLEGLVLTAVPWDNVVLHYIIPVAALVDFIIDRPFTRFSLRSGLTWLLFPIIYVAYSLTRGALTGWYPYPFLDPRLSSYGDVVATISSLLVLGIVIVWLIVRFSGKTKK